MKIDTALREDLLAFCEAFELPLFDWQREAIQAVLQRSGGRWAYPLVGISVPRGDGKTYLADIVGVQRLVSGRPGTRVLSAGLDYEGGKVLLRGATRIVQSHPLLRAVVECRADGLHVPSTGSSWIITSREHTASRGEHPDVVIGDEWGWQVDGELFASLLAGQASVVDPLTLVISTVGRQKSGPLGTIKTAAEAGDAGVGWYYKNRNQSPLVTAEFLERQRRVLLPAQFAREHQNVWVGAADSFTTEAHVDAAQGTGWAQQWSGTPGVTYDVFVDVGAVHDPSVVCLGHLDEDDRVVIDRLDTYQGSREEPVQMHLIEQAIIELSRRFTLRKVRVESWQGLASVQRLDRLRLPVELFTPTAKTNSDEWPILAQRLANRTLVLPLHDRLRAELLNLVVEIGPTGARIIDRGSLHQDHAVAVRGVTASLSVRRERECLAIIRVGDRFEPPTDQQASLLLAGREDDPNFGNFWQNKYFDCYNPHDSPYAASLRARIRAARSRRAAALNTTTDGGQQ